MKILIMGLPGSGKTTLARQLVTELEFRGRSVLWLNADVIRQASNDWDFTPTGRLRQSKRMLDLAQAAKEDFVVADFVAALDQQRVMFGADCLVWMDTIQAGRYADTNQAFEPPGEYHFRVCQHSAIWPKKIADFATGVSR